MILKNPLRNEVEAGEARVGLDGCFERLGRLIEAHGILVERVPDPLSAVGDQRSFG